MSGWFSCSQYSCLFCVEFIRRASASVGATVHGIFTICLGSRYSLRLHIVGLWSVGREEVPGRWARGKAVDVRFSAQRNVLAMPRRQQEWPSHGDSNHSKQTVAVLSVRSAHVTRDAERCRRGRPHSRC